MMNKETVNLFDGFALDLARGCLLRAQRPIHLRPQAYEVLRYLVENKSHLISKDQLIAEVWQGRAVTDGSLGKCIEEVREALGPESRQYIRTVRGRGYIYDPEFSETTVASPLSAEQIEIVRLTIEDDAPYSTVEPISHQSVSSTPDLLRLGWTKRLALTFAGLAIVASAGFIGYKLSTSRPSPVAAVTSVAVLPFINETGNSDLEYLSDGISESLINSFSKFSQLRVIARNSSFQYKGKKVDPKDVSRNLGVEAILLGRVSQRGDDVIVSAELVDRNETQIWGERFVRKATDFQVLEKEITRAISDKLRLRLSGVQEQQLTKRATQNPEAYELYLNGIFLFRQPGNDGIKKSLDYFTRAVALDPNFAPAWLEVGRVNSFLAGNSLTDPNEPVAKAKVALNRALELDETLADAHCQLGRIKRGEWNWSGADQEYLRALELNGNLADAHHDYSVYLSIMGRHSEALAEIKRAQELDPLRVSLRRREAFTLSLARHHAEAVDLAERTMALEPTQQGQPYFGLGLIYASAGKHLQAIEAYRKAISILGETTSLQCYLGYSLAKAGKQSAAESILSKLKKTKDYVSPTEFATFYVGLGDTEAAIKTLEKAYTQHDLQLATIRVDILLDPLRSDPRFRDLLRRVGFPES